MILPCLEEMKVMGFCCVEGYFVWREVVGGDDGDDVVEEGGAEEPVSTAVDDGWLGVLEMPEPDTELNVTVGAAN